MHQLADDVGPALVTSLATLVGALDGAVQFIRAITGGGKGPSVNGIDPTAPWIQWAVQHSPLQPAPWSGSGIGYTGSGGSGRYPGGI